MTGVQTCALPISYAIAYRDEKKTLEDKDIAKVHDKILKALEHKLGAVLR